MKTSCFKSRFPETQYCGFRRAVWLPFFTARLRLRLVAPQAVCDDPNAPKGGSTDQGLCSGWYGPDNLEVLDTVRVPAHLAAGASVAGTLSVSSSFVCVLTVSARPLLVSCLLLFDSKSRWAALKSTLLHPPFSLLKESAASQRTFCLNAQCAFFEAQAMRRAVDFDFLWTAPHPRYGAYFTT